MDDRIEREIVIEIERVKTIRKRCRTRVMFCPECLSKADFITLREAALLFEVEPSLLRRFIRHQLKGRAPQESESLICIASLLEGIRSAVDPTINFKTERTERLPRP